MGVPAPSAARAQEQEQESVPMRALELENAGRWREAAVAYRAALTAGSAMTTALLGLERVYHQLGKSDSLIPLLDSLLTVRPRDQTLRTVHLRTLVYVHRDGAAAAAFERWVRIAPREAAPYREYARLLLDGGRAARADTVLQRAQAALGGTRDVTVELAQMRAATGLWELSARSWREALATTPYLDQAAVFSLFPTPDSLRPAVRGVFRADPPQVDARRALASLELRWRSAREGWAALRDLPPTDSTVNAWIEFAGLAEEAGAPLIARDALVAALAHRDSRDIAVRAATNALNGGEPKSAVAILERIGDPRDSEALRTVLPLRVRVLSALGRAGEAEALIAEHGGAIDSLARARLIRASAWGWVRAGDLSRARAALRAVGEDDDDRTTGWIALYEGDLGAARQGLRRATESNADLVLALAFLSRTRADSAPLAGEAFLSLARGDSAKAAEQFEASAAAMNDAAPLLLSAAARIHVARRDDARALALWQRVAEHHASAPEAAEAQLEWARALRRQGQTHAAVKRLESMILTYPQSALVPQARRELDLARQNVPSPT